MRWQIIIDGKIDRLVDADFIRNGAGVNHFRALEFVSGDAVVFTISAGVRGLVGWKPTPTFRLVGGPKAGQVGALDEADRPAEAIHFQPVVALNENGETIAPVAPRLASGLTDSYIHHPTDCPCWRMGRMVWEHVYIWPADLYAALGKELPGGHED